MKLLLKTVLLTTLVSFLGLGAFAQSSTKDLDKKTKAELKEYIKNPASFRAMMKSQEDQMEAYELQLNEVQEDYYRVDYLKNAYQDSILVLNDSLEKCQPKTIYLTDTVNDAGTDLLANTTNNISNTVSTTDNMVNKTVTNPDKNTASNNSNAVTNTGGTFTDNGIDYRVQIGAYRYFDFTNLIRFNKAIGYEKISGITYYYLGSWSNSKDAYSFAEALRKLNIKDAFVTKYVDGERVPFDYLLEGQTADN